MDIFPYVSSYIILYAIVAFIVLIIVPAPYGKFARQSMPLQINPRVAWFLNEVSALVFLAIGWLENGTWRHDMPQTNKGWVCFLFLIVHFVWRSTLSQLVIEWLIQPPNGTKQTSILLPLLSVIYLSLVGMNFRRMCSLIDDEFQDFDLIFVCGASFCFLANAFVDIQYNRWRKSEGSDKSEYLGRYLTREELAERFGLLNKLGFECPNYLFEMLEWGFFALLAFRWEAFWWFVGTVLFLLPRSIWTSHWYMLGKEVQVTYKSTKPKVLNQRKIIF